MRPAVDTLRIGGLEQGCQSLHQQAVYTVGPAIFASSDYLLTSTGGIFSKIATLMKQFEVFGLKFMYKMW